MWTDRTPSHWMCTLWGGYNDLVEGYSRYFIFDRLEKFGDMVKQANANLHQNTSNTVAIATFMYPPQLAWYADNGPYPCRDYVNQKEKIDWLNVGIKGMNIRNNVPNFVRVHTYGVRKVTRKYTDRYGQQHQRVVKSHRWEHWREPDRSNKLHLSNLRRYKMGQALNNYFILNT